MPIAVGQAPRPRRGCWHRLPGSGGRPSNWIGYTCPSCGQTTVTATGDGDKSYSVSKDGTLTPDFVCANGDCDYTVPLRLKGWTAPSISISSDSDTHPTQ